MPARAEQTAAHVEQAAAEVTADAKSTAADAKAAVADAKQTANTAAKSVAASAKQASSAVTAAAGKVAVAAEKVATSPSQGTIAQWKSWTAEQLVRVPDIRLYGTLKLKDLADRGPAAARQVWTTAKDALGQDLGNTTIDDLLAEWQAVSGSR